jgi:hypothetical protein
MCLYYSRCTSSGEDSRGTCIGVIIAARLSMLTDPLLFLSTLQSKFNPKARMHAGGYVFGALNIHFIYRSVLIM